MSDERPERWQMPEFEDDNEPMFSHKENLFNYHPAPAVEAEPEPLADDELADMPMLTAEALEQMREDAVAEGRAEGYEQGFQQGLEAGREQGHAEGLEAGKAEGFEHGAAAGAEFVEQQAQRFAQMNDALHAPMTQVDRDVEQQLVELTTALARAVLKVELKTNPEVILAALKEAAGVLPFNARDVQIQVHPGDLEMIKQYYPAQTIAERGWHLLAEPTLEPGQLRAETEVSGVTIDPWQRIDDLAARYLEQRYQYQSSPTDASVEQTELTSSEPTTSEPTTEDAAPAPSSDAAEQASDAAASEAEQPQESPSHERPE